MIFIIIVNLLSLRAQISTEIFLHMRYDGTDCALICNVSPCQTEKVISRGNTCTLLGFLARYSDGNPLAPFNIIKQPSLSFSNITMSFAQIVYTIA